MACYYLICCSKFAPQLFQFLLEHLVLKDFKAKFGITVMLELIGTVNTCKNNHRIARNTDWLYIISWDGN